MKNQNQLLTKQNLELSIEIKDLSERKNNEIKNLENLINEANNKLETSSLISKQKT